MTDAGVIVTATTEFDYSLYFENSEPPLCNNSDTREFSRVFLTTLYSLVFILGFIGNGLVVCVLVKHRTQSTLTDICLCNLALSDLLFVFTLPFYAHYIVTNQWTFGDFMCRFLSGSHHIGFFSSVFFMIIMTLDRYVVIVHTHKMARFRTLKAGGILTVTVWMLSLGVSLPAFVFTMVINESGVLECDYNPENEDWHDYNLFSTNVLGLIIPLLVMVVCYSRIIPTLVNMRTAKKHRVIRLVILVMAVFFVFWAPYNISIFLGFLQGRNLLRNDCTWNKNVKLSIAVTETFAYTHCCLNPIIYAFVGQKFMKRALQMVKKWVPGSSRRWSNSSFKRSSSASRSSVTSTVMI